MTYGQASLGVIWPCQAPACDIATNKRYVQKGVVLVACCSLHAETAYELRGQTDRLVAVA
jgi:hypothetical protein